MNIVGTSQPIHDAEEKASGACIYAGDMIMPGMLHAAMLLSPLPHAAIKSVNAEKAEALPGVRAVLHCFNTTEKKFNRYRNLHGQQVIEDERVFNDRARFIGDRVACAVAETPEIAREAVRLIEVVYETLPFSTSIRETLTGKIDGIHELGAVCGEFEQEIGAPPETEDGEIVTETFSRLSRLSHVTMEPHACVAE
jgi:xanthine dehydrogenase molybdenum-binding subunit